MALVVKGENTFTPCGPLAWVSRPHCLNIGPYCEKAMCQVRKNFNFISCVCVYTEARLWSSFLRVMSMKYRFLESVLFFHLSVGSRNGTWVTGFVQQASTFIPWAVSLAHNPLSVWERLSPWSGALPHRPGYRVYKLRQAIQELPDILLLLSPQCWDYQVECVCCHAWLFCEM